MDTLIFLLLLLLAVWFWSDSVKNRDIASSWGRKMCQRFQLQLLDDTISLKHIHFQKQSNSQAYFRWHLMREYGFEFSINGEQRVHGRIYLRAHHVLGIELPGYYENILFTESKEAPDHDAKSE